MSLLLTHENTTLINNKLYSNIFQFTNYTECLLILMIRNVILLNLNTELRNSEQLFFPINIISLDNHLRSGQIIT